METNSSTLLPSTEREIFYTIFRCVTTATSLFSNSLLLFVICISPSSHLGHYRFLLAIFAICDIGTSLMHEIFQPIVHLTSTGGYAISRQAGQRVFRGVSLDIPIVLAFLATFYQTFLILAYHYVYRYRTVTRILRSTWTDRWSVWQWLTLGFSVYILYISALLGICSIALLPDEWTRLNAPSELLDSYGLDVRNPDIGYVCFVALRKCAGSEDSLCWHWPTVTAIIAILMLFGATAGVIAYCIYQTNATFRSASEMMTPKTKNMQRHLFNALLIQTAIPLLFSYAPLSAIILIPSLTGSSIGDAGNLFCSATEIFPAIDAFFVLFFIKKYRFTVVRLFRLPISSTAVSTSSSDMQESKITSVHPHKISVQISRV